MAGASGAQVFIEFIAKLFIVGKWKKIQIIMETSFKTIKNELSYFWFE